jgi:shikimate dehydrogenase
VLPQIDVLINCTTVGSAAQAAMSPVAGDDLARLPSSAQVFDIIYQPSPSALLSLASARGLVALDGTNMNLEQAVLAYGYAAAAPRGVHVTRSAMEDAKKKLG